MLAGKCNLDRDAFCRRGVALNHLFARAGAAVAILVDEHHPAAAPVAPPGIQRDQLHAAPARDGLGAGQVDGAKKIIRGGL